MSTNQTNSTNTQCQKCTHKEPTLTNGTFFCKIHDEHYLKDPINCEDWEEKNVNEQNIRECE